MSVSRCVIPAVCAALALSGCTHTPEPVTLDTIDWAARQPVYLIVEAEREPERLAAAAANNAARAALQSKGSPDYDSATLMTVIDDLAQATGIDFIVNWSALANSEIAREAPVTLRLHDATAERVLRLALEQASAETFDDERAGFEILEGAVHITTRAALHRQLELRLYDVNDLIADNLVLAEAIYADQEHALVVVRMLREAGVLADFARIELNLRLSSEALGGNFGGSSGGGGGGDGGGGGGGGGLFGDNNEPSAAEVPRTNMQLQRVIRVGNLVDLIEDGVGDPDDWWDEVFSIRETNGGLAIATTAENHEAIHALLAEVRQSRAMHYRRQLVLVELAVLLKRAEDHRLNQDYDAALVAIDQALRVDPHSPEAVAMREVVVATQGRGE